VMTLIAVRNFSVLAETSIIALIISLRLKPSKVAPKLSEINPKM
jgi:hypothetical protein